MAVYVACLQIYELFLCCERRHESTLIFILGGTGLSLFDGCLAAEELAYACSGVGTAIVANELAVSYIFMNMIKTLNLYSWNCVIPFPY